VNRRPRLLHFDQMPLERLWGGTLSRSAVRSDNSLVTLNWFDPDATRPEPHLHPFDQLSFVVSGVLNFEVDGERFTMDAGSVLWIPPNALHTAWPSGRERVLNIDIFAPARDDYLYLATHQEWQEDPNQRRQR